MIRYNRLTEFTAKQERLLRQCIDEKWSGIAAVGTPAAGEPDCALCGGYYGDRGFGDPRCVGCPIAIVAGDTYCKGTPYYDWSRAEGDGFCEDASRHAKRELRFLRTLLRKGLEVREAAK